MRSISRVHTAEPTVPFTLSEVLRLLNSFSGNESKQKEIVMSVVRAFLPASQQIVQPAAKSKRIFATTQRQSRKPITWLEAHNANKKSKDIARLMGVTRWRVMQLVREAKEGNGNFPYYQIGVRSYRFSWNEIKVWMAQNASRQTR